jgi:hypothetical protein
MSVEQLKTTLENLPSLKNLEFTVYGCDLVVMITFNDEPSSIVAQAQYVKEQAEEAAELIGKTYARFTHLKLEIDDWRHEIEPIVLNYFEKHYPGASLIK